MCPHKRRLDWKSGVSAHGPKILLPPENVLLVSIHIFITPRILTMFPVWGSLDDIVVTVRARVVRPSTIA